MAPACGATASVRACWKVHTAKAMPACISRIGCCRPARQACSTCAHAALTGPLAAIHACHAPTSCAGNQIVGEVAE